MGHWVGKHTVSKYIAHRISIDIWIHQKVHDRQLPDQTQIIKVSGCIYGFYGNFDRTSSIENNSYALSSKGSKELHCWFVVFFQGNLQKILRPYYRRSCSSTASSEDFRLWKHVEICYGTVTGRRQAKENVTASSKIPLAKLSMGSAAQSFTYLWRNPTSYGIPIYKYIETTDR